MKKLTTLLLLLSNSIFGQQKATPFDKFISKPAVEWAAYISDTVRFKKLNLNSILFTRLAKNEIRASLPVSSGTSETQQIRFLKKKDIDAVKFRGNEVAVFDESGNMTATENSLPPLDTASLTLTDVTQILYIENGQVKTYIPWVSTMLPVITSLGVYLGEGDYFSTCFNYKYNYQAPKQDKITRFGNTRRKISLDSFEVRKKLKELYGRNLIQSLWPYIINDKFKIFDCTTNQRVKAAELDAALITGARLPVPVYDSTGMQVATKTIQEALSPDGFTSVVLAEDWYYNHTGNIVFTVIREVYLYAKKWNGYEVSSQAEPILKLVFQ
jgi:hypothetical protein